MIEIMCNKCTATNPIVINSNEYNDDITLIRPGFLAKISAKMFIGKEPTDENIKQYSEEYANRMLFKIRNGDYDNESYVMPENERTYEFQYKTMINKLTEMRDNNSNASVVLHQNIVLKKESILDDFNKFLKEYNVERIHVKVI